MVVIIVLGAMLVTSLMPGEEIMNSELIDQIAANNVESILLKDKENVDVAVITLKKEVEVIRFDEKGKEKKVKLRPDTEYELVVSENFDKFITDILNSPAEEGSGKPDFDYLVKNDYPPAWVAYIPMVLMFGVVVLFLFIFMGQNSSGGGKVMNFGRSRARLYTTSNVKFENVAGADEEKEELEELVSFLKNPKKYTELGARIPKGVLMVGPPGTGKTYLAKAVAGEAGVPFFSISGSDFVEMYVGVGAARVRDLFEQAKKNSPCIIFIDEIDAVGRHRGAGMGGGHDEREQTLNQLLVEMDGFRINEGIIIIAATNRPDILDPALTRPGRFDRKIVVGYPDIAARQKMLEVHAKNKPVAEEVDLGEVAKNTSGFTAADIENLMNESALLAARDDKKAIEPGHIKEAVFRVIVGPEKRSRVMTEKAKKLTAYHEAGHAIAVKVISSTDKVDRVSIIPAGTAGGYTAHRPDDDQDYVTKGQLFEHIVVSLGGKAAEELMLGDVSTGASSDLQTANNIAMSMVAKYGMSDVLGNVIMNTGSDEVFLGKDYGHTRTASEELSATVDREVKKIIDAAYEKAKQILIENKDKLEKITQVLLEKEKIEGDEFNALMEEN
ncbi:MAG: ATP-dependent zinc metalloprotease FtsH [Clostridia bacterium]|nr:ATP-dependent zinc metalloprotease FtsH [Clostridia bacterium]